MFSLSPNLFLFPPLFFPSSPSLLPLGFHELSAYGAPCLQPFDSKQEKQMAINLNLRSTNPNKFPSFKWFHACAHHSYENLTNSVTFGKFLGSEMRRKVFRDGRFLLSALIRPLALDSHFSFYLSRETREGHGKRASK